MALGVVGYVAECVCNQPLQRADGGDGLLGERISREEHLLTGLCAGGGLDVLLVRVALDGIYIFPLGHNTEYLGGVILAERLPGQFVAVNAHCFLLRLLNKEVGVSAHDIVVAVDEGVERLVEVLAETLEVLKSLSVLLFAIIALQHHHCVDEGSLKGFHLVSRIGARGCTGLIGYAALADEVDIDLQLSVG